MTTLTALKKEDFIKLLSEYCVGNYKSHKHANWALQNTIYFIKTTKCAVVLKIFEYSEIQFIRFQLDVIEYVAKHKMIVADVLFTKDAKDILDFKGKKMILQKFLKGKIPKIFTHALIKDIARKLGTLNKILIKLPLHDKFVWTFDHEFKRKKLIGTSPFSGYKKKESALLASLKKLNRSKLRRSVIHGDFHEINCL